MALFNYECDEVKRIIEEVSPNYPQLTTYEKEWIYFYKYEYTPGTPVDLEWQEVIVNPTGIVQNAIPYSYKSAILKGNTDENLQSVKMPVLTTIGKNIFHESLLNKVYKKTIDGEEYFICEGSITANSSFIIDGNKINNKNQITFSFDVVNPNSATWATVYVEYSDHQYVTTLSILRTNRVSITSLVGKTISRIAFTTESRKEVYIKNIQLEYNNTSTTYEPYKSNILTVNEDMTLRSNGSVYDELDLLTGKLTQRIDEDGSVLTQEVVKTVNLTKLDKPYEGTNNYHLTANIPCEAILEVPVVSTGEQTLQEINNY